MSLIDIFSDTLKRHQRRCLADASLNAALFPLKQRGRIRRSCQRCFRMKIRCDGLVPCENCSRSCTACIRIAQPERNDHIQMHEASSSSMAPFSLIPDTNTASTTANLDLESSLAEAFSGTAMFTGQDVWPFILSYGSPGLQDRGSDVTHWSESSGSSDDADVVPYEDREKVMTDPESSNYPWRDSFDAPGTLITLAQVDPLEARCAHIREICQRGDFAVPQVSANFLIASLVRDNIALFSKYFAAHTPIVHLPSFDISTVSSFLLFSMVSIGAAFTKDGLKHKRIRLCLRMSKTLLAEAQSKNEVDKTEIIQGLCILHILRTFEGGRKLRETARLAFGEIVTVSHLLRINGLTK